MWLDITELHQISETGVSLKTIRCSMTACSLCKIWTKSSLNGSWNESPAKFELETFPLFWFVFDTSFFYFWTLTQYTWSTYLLVVEVLIPKVKKQAEWICLSHDSNELLLFFTLNSHGFIRQNSWRGFPSIFIILNFLSNYVSSNSIPSGFSICRV